MMKFSAVARIFTAGALIALVGAAAAQQSYPSKPIRFIVPFPPGGGTNIMARLVGQKLTESWGQPVIVDNRPGGNAVIGSEVMVKSPPDGHTILAVNSTHVVTPLLHSSIPYDSIKDFAPVATLASSETVLVLHPSIPVNNLRELIALAKSKPGQLNYATTGSGGVMHLSGESFNIMVGVKMQHIPYKGGGPLMVDLVGGQVQLSFNVPIATMAHLKSGKLKAIAITGATRLPTLPQVPTFAEAGLPGYDVKYWYGVLAPAATPKANIEKLSAEIGKILSMPDVREKLAAQGVDPFINTPDQFAALMRADMDKYAKVIKTANIKIEH